MKRLFIMLLLACSAIITVNAYETANPQKKPENVIFVLNAIINKFGQNEGQVYSVNRNPNTGIIESSTKIVPFSCPANAMKNDNVLNAVAINFPKEEPLAYQFLHIQPGSNEQFQLKIMTDNGTNGHSLRIRTNKKQEMWLMCCKNPENPQLRDAYAVTWQYVNDQKSQVAGTVYMLTSLRPDLFEKSMSSSVFAKESSDAKKVFRLEGRVGDDLTDSLYVFYMAPTGEELNSVTDDSYVATMPVINRNFSFTLELDKPMVGRIRTVMPDGSLCQLWTNIDCVPGETYHITTHNGWYEEDRLYERRVGRYSGKSLLTERQIQGNDDVDVLPLEADTVPIYDPTPENADNTDFQMSEKERLRALVMVKAGQELSNIEPTINMIKATYQHISEIWKVKTTMGANAGKAHSDAFAEDIEKSFKRIVKLNKELDNDVQAVAKAVNDSPLSQKVKADVMGDSYRAILDFLTEQNKAFSAMVQQTGSLPKAAVKTQKYVNELTAKYMAKAVKYTR